MHKQLTLQTGKMEQRSVQTWRRPELRKLNAGAAEQGGSLTTDLGLAHS